MSETLEYDSRYHLTISEGLDYGTERTVETRDDQALVVSVRCGSYESYSTTGYLSNH